MIFVASATFSGMYRLHTRCHYLFYQSCYRCPAIAYRSFDDVSFRQNTYAGFILVLHHQAADLVLFKFQARVQYIPFLIYGNHGPSHYHLN